MKKRCRKCGYSIARRTSSKDCGLCLDLWYMEDFLRYDSDAAAATHLCEYLEACDEGAKKGGGGVFDFPAALLEAEGCVSAAGGQLDKAENEFAEGAFAPFWDEIERAANNLAAYRNQVAVINRLARIGIAYQTVRKRSPACLPVQLAKGALPDARPAAIRLSAMVRAAQKDFQFATIYELRKTNKLLVAGFKTLALAISDLGDAIYESLNDLSRNLHVSLGELVKQAAADAAHRREFEREVVESQSRQEEMLDNIQRRRKPQ